MDAVGSIDPFVAVGGTTVGVEAAMGASAAGALTVGAVVAATDVGALGGAAHAASRNTLNSVALNRVR
jgi:hypothetical protein